MSTHPTPSRRTALLCAFVAGSACAVVVTVGSDAGARRRLESPDQGTSGQPVASAPSARLSLPGDDVGDFYYYGDRRIPLRRSRTLIAVRVAPGLSQEGAPGVVRALVEGAVIERAGTPGTRHLTIVRVPAEAKDVARRDPEAAHLQLNQAWMALNTSASVVFALPVLVNPETGSRLLLTDEILAKLHPGTDPAAVAAEFGLTPVRALWATSDEYVFRVLDPKSSNPLDIANAMAVSGLVIWAEPDFVQEYQKTMTPNDPLYPTQWHLNNTGQLGGVPGADARLASAWDVTTGSPSIVVAVIDDGVEFTHEDLSANVFTNPNEVPGNGIDDDFNGYVDDVNGWDFSNGDSSPLPLATDDNHGTAVAGVAAGRGNNAIGITGACQQCRILPVKIFSPDYAGDSVAADAIRYAASLADVLNSSWGGTSPSAAIQSAIQWAVTNGRGGRGAVPVFSTGNSATGFVTFSLTGVPAGTHAFRWRYVKDGSVSSGDDTVWLAWVQFPGGEMVNFESAVPRSDDADDAQPDGLPSGWTTGGDANWSVVTDRTHADEGFCQTRSAKAGTITHSQSTHLQVTKTVGAGTLAFRAWVSSESSFDKMFLDFDQDNDGSWSSFFGRSGVPAVVTSVAYPAAYPESFAVGALSDQGCRSAYSQYGPELDFVAPSNGGLAGITTTDRTGTAGYNTASNYTSTFGGTSSAAPLSSGIAALLLSRDPSMTVALVRQTLQNTAREVGTDPYVPSFASLLGPSGRNDRYGYGVIDAAAAMASLGGCTYQINPTSVSVAAAGASGSVTVTADAGCAWTAVSSAPWITVTSGASGTGNGTVGYTVAANAVASPRTGTVTIGGRTFTVNQAAACVYSIDPASAVAPAGGSTGTVTVTAGGGCAWTAVSNNAWIIVTSGASGSGSGSVGYSVLANAGASRTGTITIAGLTFTVSQAGAGCGYAIDPTSVSAPVAGTSGTVAVTAGAGCGWTAVSNDAWITVTSGASGNGSGTVGYTVAANSGAPRSGTVTIGWQTFTVNQAGVQFTDISAALLAVDRSAVAWGDYDSDGDLDVLLTGCTMNAANTLCNILNSRVYRNDGGGTFTNLGVSLTGIKDGVVAWGDYDNDGALDFALSGCNWSGISPVNGNPVCWGSTSKIYRNTGGGSFSDINAGLPATSFGSLSWGDCDNDGDLDLLAGHTLFRNDGGNVFTSAWTGPNGFGTDSSWGDYDNDGELDILAAGLDGATAVARVYRNDGNGVFTDIAAGLTGVFSAGLAWGDYDNDGDLDILIAGRTGQTVSDTQIARVYRNDGGGVFTNISAALTGVTGNTLAWGDYDNDGRLDILLTGHTGSAWVAKVYRNGGSGVFADAAEAFPSSALWGSWGDYDNDGKLDLLLSGNFTSRIYRNGATTANTVPAAPAGLGTTVLGGRATLQWSAPADGQTPAAGLTYNVRVGTTPGSADIVGPMASSATGYRRVPQNGNAGHGTTALVSSLAARTYYWSVQAIDTTFAGSPFAAEGSFVVCGTTINPATRDIGAAGGTGTVAVTAVPGCQWLAVSNVPWITVTSGANGTGNGSVGYSVAANAGAARSGTITIGTQTFTVNQASGCIYTLNPTSAAFGAAGGPGTVGVTTLPGCPWTAVSNSPWLTVTGGAAGNGNGTVTYTAAGNTTPARNGTLTIAGSNFPVAQAASLFSEVAAGLANVYDGPLAWGDYDSDGDLDILLGGYSGLTVTKIFRNDGGGTFTDIGAGISAVSHGAAAWGDYDRDGDLDVLIAGSALAKVYRNDGGGTFTDTSAGLTGVNDASVAWGDYDNDGDLDILLAGRASGGPTAKVYRNDGGGTFTDVGAALVGVEQCAVAWGDFDNDGDLDIALSGYTGSERVTRVYRNTGGNFADIATGLTGVMRSTLAWGDYDNDGDLDLLLTGDNASGNWAKVYRNNGNGTFTDIAAPLTAVSNGSARWGDFDNDGDLDILRTGWNTTTTTLTTVYRNDGGGTFTDLAENLLGVGNSAGEWGDYDNDGRLDILITGTTGGTFNTRLYRNTTPVANALPSAPTGLTATPGGSQVTLGWGAANDAQTPAAGLTYNLRVGTSPGGTQIVAPMASVPAGYRRVPQMGNAGPGTTAWLSSLPPGRYYWSVQTVDSAFAGSPFAAEMTFDTCSIAINPAGVNVGSGLGNGTVAVTAGAGCAWTAVSNAAWINVTSGASGSGNGSVGYTVAPNIGPARVGTITIGGQTFTVTQASGCAFAINPTSANVSAAGASGTVAVTTAAGCTWTAASNAPWTTVTSGASGSGNGSVGYTVAATTGPARTGTVTIAGQVFTVNQASGCVYAINPTSANVAAAGTSGSVAVTTAAGCAWTAAGNVAWISITSGASGTGNGNVGYSVAANNGAARSGTATIAGRVFTVNQALGQTPTLTPSPTALRIGAVNDAGTLTRVTPAQTVTVSQSGGAGVGWTASADVPWLTIAAADANGTGTGTFTVTLNNTGNVLPATGTVNGTITITAPGATGSPTVAVQARLYPPGDTLPPFGLTSSPAQGTDVQGAVGITGWVLDDIGIDHVRLYRNCLPFEDQLACQTVAGQQVVWMGDATLVAGARSDIEGAYPEYPQNNRAGFGYAMLSNLSPHIPNQEMFGGQGPLTIYIRARDVEGNEAWVGQNFLPGSTILSDEQPTSITMSNDTIAKPFGTIDTPTQGQTVSGSLWNWGWALTPDGNTAGGEAGDILMPTNGSTIRVWIDGASPGTVLYNMCRGAMSPYCIDDIASIFGNPTPQAIGTPRAGNPTKFRNLDANRGAIAGFFLDTTTLANGVHTIAWSAFDSATPTPRGDGLGSRYFTVLNVGAGDQGPGTGSDALSRRDTTDPRSPVPDPRPPADVLGRTGFSLDAPFVELRLDAEGICHVQIDEMGRLELQFGPDVRAGYLVVNNEYRPLPVGSQFDAATGTFTWAPGVGFIGTYRLAFGSPRAEDSRSRAGVVRGISGTTPALERGSLAVVDVTIRPASTPTSGEAAIRMHLDTPQPGATVSGPFLVAGWALDPRAAIDSGIGAVHVWAQRTDVAGAAPVFLGVAEVGGARPDVAGLYGPPFTTAGFNLAAPGLPPGTYDITAYVWANRTVRWEDAGTVSVNVR